MTKYYPSELERLTGEVPAGERGWRGGTDLLSERQRPLNFSTRFTAKPVAVSSPDQAPRVDWAMVVIWGCGVLSFAAFFVCGYIIWLKCRGDWPY
jgi:hypothetical protein